ncbi:MAG: toll/interleukin-1 receptor domain-containing protein [Planctomycetota bacterium]
MSVDKKDIFLCHASEDKAEVVTPLVKALDDAEITYWYDQAEIKWGDSITQKVNDGLKISRYVVVILSEAFLPKKWPQRELNSALNVEASDGDVRVLPLLFGSERIRNLIIKKYPLLSDKAYIVWDEGVEAVVEALKRRLAQEKVSAREESNLGSETPFDIPMPPMKKKFTQREKDLFLRTAFGVIKAYFREGLERLEREYSTVETDFIDVHRFKFISTIYVHGEVESKCKIWIGGPMRSDSIAYSSGQLDIDSDNSCNGWLCISDDGSKLGFDTSGLWGLMPAGVDCTIVDTEKAAACFWRGFTDVLNRT